MLIGLAVEHYLLGVLPPFVDVPIRLGQLMVMIGGLVTVTHYVCVRRHAHSLSEPDQLMTERGLYRYIRHPMYTGDLITYSGLTALAPGPVTALVLFVGIYAIWRQSIVEDRHLADRFDEMHREWRKRTFLLVPGI